MTILNLFLFFLTFFWFLIFIKKLLFWVYLWQLKEYHLGRFTAHFDTFKGKKLIFNWQNFIKFLLILSPFCAVLIFPQPKFEIFIFYFFAIFAIFSAEGLKFIFNILKNKIVLPIFTAKANLIIFLGIIFEILIILLLLNNPAFYYYFLILDFSAPLIFTFIIFSVHPVSILWRWQIIKKAKEKRRKFENLIVVGITGSYGKTSTKEFLAAILSEKFKVLKTKEHQNSEVGISQCILNELNENHQIFICEMGAYNRGGIKLLSDIIKPRIGILTGINEQHMATFGSQENIIKTKYELIEFLPEHGTAFFNGKNKYCRELYQKTRIKKFLYGENATFLGEENILGAMAVARELGMTEEEISQALKKIENKFPGIQVKKGINGLNIIDAVYSANPNGVISHLDYLKTWPGKKIIVMPCIIELGRASKDVHKRIGQKISEVCDLAIITTQDRFKEIKRGAIENGMPERNILFMENPKDIFEKIKSFSKADDVILLESRVPGELINQLISI